MKSVSAKKTSVFRRPSRSATKLMTNVYRALLRMVSVRTTPIWNGSNPR